MTSRSWLAGVALLIITPITFMICRTRTRLSRWRARLLAAGAASLATLSATAAHAEYVENYMARDFALMTLATAGSTAVAFDVGDAIYLAKGRGGQPGRIVCGVGSIVAGLGLLAGGALSLSIGGEGNVPGQGSPGFEELPEYKALTTARVLAGVEFGLAAASGALGIAALSTFHRDAGDQDTQDAAARWRLIPVTLPNRGAALTIARRF